MTTSGSGTVKWQQVRLTDQSQLSMRLTDQSQVSEDLVPVNIACVGDDPQLVFHITAYNSQVDKILDVRLVQPGKDLKIILSSGGDSNRIHKMQILFGVL